MKKIKYSLILAIACMTYFACDKVDRPYREEVVVNDYCMTGIEDTVVHKKVLVEDYTGHLCGHCPAAGLYLNDTLKGIYGHCLVVISVHAGFFAPSCPGGIACGGVPPGTYSANYNTTAGTEWNNFFGIVSNPKGMINRIDYPAGTHSKVPTGWATAVASEMAEAAKAKIKITNDLSGNTVNVTVKSDFIENLVGNYKLQVVITENNIVSWQRCYAPFPVEHDSTFVHHHILRDVLNSTWGEDIASGGVSAGTSITKTYSYSINTNWNKDECSIVAFIYDADTYKILQVEEAELVE
jgi:hypothetical protein